MLGIITIAGKREDWVRAYLSILHGEPVELESRSPQ
jgi:hypothetical protein